MNTQVVSSKEQKFYDTLSDIFIGARIEGTGGFINLMRIKSNYYKKIEELLKKDIDTALKQYPNFREELFDKLYSFFHRYFTESGSIYFNQTPFHNNIYEKVYTDDKDVILFWKTQMLYYVKTDRIFRSIEVEVDNHKFFFDVSNLEHKKANEKRNVIFEYKEKRDDDTLIFNVIYSEKGKITKTDEILKALKKQGINITEEILEKAFRVFERQSEVDFFINKNAKAFLQEQFKLWSYQYFWEGAKEWTADRVNQLQILKDIAFKIIDFVAQFEDELVRIWNKPKFVKNSNYVITLDRILNTPSLRDTPLKEGNLIERILKHPNIKEQIKEWLELGIVGENFKIEDVFEKFPSFRGDKGVFPERVVKWYELPFNPKLKERARELRKAGNLSEVLFWQKVRNKQFLGLDFDRQKIVGNYIVDFYCKNLGVVIEIDGESHIFKVEYDQERDKYLESLGLKVIHILDKDIKENLDGVLEYLRNEFENTPNPSIRGENTPNPSIRGEYLHLPIDTKYFKDLELEILGLFDDLDNELDGWLIKSENYQALNTILPKFKEKVQTIYIDPPFNLDSSDQFLYRTNYKDANWATLLENRLRLAKEWLNEKGSIFVRCDYNGNWIVRCLMDEIFGKENFRNEIVVNRSGIPQSFMYLRFNPATDSLFLYGISENSKINPITIPRDPSKIKWIPMHIHKENRYRNEIIINGEKFVAPKGRHFPSQDLVDKLLQEKRIKIVEKKYVDVYGNEQYKMPYYLSKDFDILESDWTDISGYSQTQGFPTENSEILLKRVIESTSNEGDLVMDFFVGSGTTTAVAHKLSRKWIGVEMGEHFYTVVLPRMKKVLAYDKSGISKEVKDYQGGGFFKYYELEQYEEALANTVYENHDMLIAGNKSPYEQYVFLKDEKMLRALEIDYENNKVKIDLSKLYPNTPSANTDTPLQEGNIDIAETLSNLTGKWIKKIEEDKVWLEGMDKPIDTKELDYKLIKPLIWW